MSTKYGFQVMVQYQEDRDNIYIELYNDWTGEILASGEASAYDRQAVLNCIDYMLKEHLPACK